MCSGAASSHSNVNAIMSHHYENNEKIMKVTKMRFTNINSPCRHLPGAIYAIYSARPPNSPQGKLSKVANSNQALTTLSWRVQLLGSSFRFRKRNSLFRLRVVQKVEAVT